MQTVIQSGLYFPFVEFMSAVGTVVVLWYGGTLVTGGAIQVGVLVAFIAYLASFFDPIQQLSQLYNTFQSSMAAVQKIYTVLDTEPDLTDAPDARPLRDVHGRVEFEHVTFGYGDEDVLHDVDFAVAAGRHRRPRGHDRGRQVDDHQAAGALLRPADRARCASTAPICAR